MGIADSIPSRDVERYLRFLCFYSPRRTSLALSRSPIRGLLYIRKHDSVKRNALNSSGWNWRQSRSEVPQTDLRKTREVEGYQKWCGCIGPQISGMLAVFPILCQTYFVLKLLPCSICIMSSELHVIRTSSFIFRWIELFVKLILLKPYMFWRL